jgi:hypothetical protein
MTTTHQKLLLVALGLGLGVGACDNGSAAPDARVFSGGGADAPPAATPDAPTTPSKPTLGAQIDRMGRPAINTALDKTFSADTTRDPAEDAYNADTNKSGWGASYKATFAAQLAILDSLDGTCGNQLLAGPAGAGRYDTLAGALADDQLYVNSAGTTCTQYLAVEADATAVLHNSDCGGRKPEYDVIETTYSALAAGMLTGVDDGVTNDSTFKASFPYLGDANP